MATSKLSLSLTAWTAISKGVGRLENISTTPMLFFIGTTQPAASEVWGHKLAPGATYNFNCTDGQTIYGLALTKAVDVLVTETVASNKVATIQKRFRDNFLAATADKWDVTLGSGDTFTFGAGAVLTKGVALNSTSMIITKDVFTIPCRISFGLTLSQRIANQIFMVELVSIDPVTLLPDDKEIVGWVFDGTTATSNKYRVGSNSLAVDASVTTTTTAGGGMFEIALNTEECWFHSNMVDGASGRAASFRKHTRLPDPALLYKLRIKSWNSNASAPASSTTLTISHVAVADFGEMIAEVEFCKGGGASGTAIPTNIVNTPTVNVAGGQSIALSPSGSFGWGSLGRVTSAASTNATLIKSSAGTLGFMSVMNVGNYTRYLKLYNKASAPTVGTDTPIFTFSIPPLCTTYIPLPTQGLRGATGLAFATTGGPADSDTSAVAASELFIAYAYA